MKSYKTVALPVLLGCVLSGALWSISNSPVRGQSQSSAHDAQSLNPLIRLNEKARAAENGSEAAIRELADEIFSIFNFDQAPAGMDDAIKERLVRAEINYRNGHGQGIAEANIVRMVNLLAAKLGAPAYTRTNAFEVRRLQLGVLPYLPNLLAQSRAKDKPHGAPINATLSPLEATYVAASLIQQKRYNAEYQLTQTEWVALHGGKRKDKANEKFHEQMKDRRKDSSRTDEVERAIAQGFTAMSPAEILNLPQKLLDTLGVER
jgi:hypothetical protein